MTVGSLLHGIRANLRDARHLGPGVLLRHWAALRGAGRHRWTMPGVGPLEVRTHSTDTEVLRQVFVAREYDLSGMKRWRDIETRYRALLAAGRTPLIVDAGANIGAASLWFARLFPEAAVVAIEPEPENAECCRRNTAASPRITVHEAAIGAKPGRIRLENPADKAWSVRSARSDTGDGIAIVTINGLLDALPDASLFIAKIDIEGFESDLFAEALEWIDKATLLFIEIHDWMLPGRGTSFALQKAMGERRFEMLIRGENLVYVAPPVESGGISL